MPFGKLYTYDGNPRSTAIRVVAKANKVDLEIVETNPAKGVSNDYLRINHLGKIPSFVGEDGYELTESIAIAIYITSQNEKTSLLGKTKQDYASIVRWMSFANQEILIPLAGWFRPLIGRDPYNKKAVDDAQKATLKAVGVLEQHLLVNTFLVGERVTLADFYAASIVSRGFEFVFDKKWRSEYPNVTRWYETIFHQPIYSEVAGDIKLVDEAVKYEPPKKEKAPKEKKEKKEEPKPKAKEVEDAEEEEDSAPAPAPKPKHPCEELGKPTWNIDEWKRKYSNCGKKYRTVMPWFWENLNTEEYSIWRMDYIDNDKLTYDFMSSNAASGLIQRLDPSRKYLFGALGVYGETNDFVIQGAWVLRGQEADPVFGVAGEYYESFTCTKLDPSKPEDRAFVEDEWVGDKDALEIGGKQRTYTDSKSFY